MSEEHETMINLIGDEVFFKRYILLDMNYVLRVLTNDRRARSHTDYK